MRTWRWAIALILLLVVGTAAATTHRLWVPRVRLMANWVATANADAHDDEHSEEGDAGHDEHAHAEDGTPEHSDVGIEEPEDHAEHDETTSIVISDQARKNIDLTLFTVRLDDFQRTVTVPAAVVERPGRSEITVSAPMTGIITRIYPIRGEAVAPGDRLFELRLTHEDLVEKQTALLRDLEQLDVVKQEIERLEDVARTGAVAGKQVLDRVYERQQIEASIRAEREALLLHGLTEAQLVSIETDRHLVREIVVTTPEPDVAHVSEQHDDFLQVAGLAVNRGDHVATGTPLAILTDHCELYIEGQAFEHDADVLNQAANRGAAVSALIQANGDGKGQVPDLHILYVESQVERDSRALKFYVSLPNQLVRNDSTPDGHRFIAWQFKPGQRVEILVPVETWKNRIVVPIESVIQEGAEWFVYKRDGDAFERESVHVEYRDQQSAVIENDGSVTPGDQIAARGAYLIHLALKNRAGGGVDPHAGHNH